MEQARFEPKAQWGLILGASSGFGAATALELARRGLNIVGVHMDTRATLPAAQDVAQEIRNAGREALFFNINAASEEKRHEVLSKTQEHFRQRPGTIKVLLHSLAFGALKPYISQSEEVVTKAQLEMTLDVMANSLVYWVQDLMKEGLMERGGRVYALTSAGSTRVIPYYGPVSAAKAALEAHIRQLACELGPLGITANGIKAGVTDTPALRKIPGNEKMLSVVGARNPSGRTTTPQDVASAIATLALGDAVWINGAIINVDGGEDIVAF